MEVVNLTVENDPDALVLVADGLVTAANINDGKPTHAESDAPAAILAKVIRASMSYDPAHGSESGVRGLFRPVEVQDAVDSAHGLPNVSNFFVAMIEGYFASVSIRAFSTRIDLPASPSRTLANWPA